MKDAPGAWMSAAMRRAFGVAVFGIVSTAAVPAVAQSSGQLPVQESPQQATARLLFDDARALMQKGEYVQACPKLEAASKLYAGSGVLLNLGDCYEHLGRTASAFAAFGAAAAMATRLNRPDHEAEARRRQTALESRLCRLTVHVTRDVPGLVVKDGASAVDRAAWGVALPADPGTHVLRVQAPGTAGWSTSVELTEGGAPADVVVPDLPAVGNVPSTPPEPPPSFWTGRRVLSAGIAGLGVVGMAVAGGLVLDAKGKYDTATAETGLPRRNDSQSAVGEANVGTGVFIAGAVCAAAGVVLWLTAPSASTGVGTNGSGVFVRGSF
jgi:hypothetical protein